MDVKNEDMGIAKRVLELPKSHPTRIWFEENFFMTREPKKVTLSIKKGDLVKIKGEREGIIIKYPSNSEIHIGFKGIEFIVNKEDIIAIISSKEEREKVQNEKSDKAWSEIIG